MTDSKSRKVIILENTYLPAYVKEHIAQALFENLKVSLAASALELRIGSFGVVHLFCVTSIECLWKSDGADSRLRMARDNCDSRKLAYTRNFGKLTDEVYYSRPLYHLSNSTPLAGKTLYRRLKALVKLHATYYPPPASFSNLKRQAIRPVPPGVLTDNLVERILTETCFVGGIIVSRLPTSLDEPMRDDQDEPDRELAALAEMYAQNSTAKDLPFPIPAKGDMGPGTLVIPGWIRERAAEVLFHDDLDSESESITETILQTLLKVGTSCFIGTFLISVTH